MTNQATALDVLDSPEAVDPELLALPAPPKGERSLIVALLLGTAIASLAMVFMLRKDAAYAFASPSIDDLGEIGTAPRARFAENRYVRGTGLVGATGAIRYERPLRSDTFRALPLAGHPDVWVEVRLAPGQESARYVPPSSFAGRLVQLDAAGPKHRGLRGAIEDATGQKVQGQAWLLVDGDAPQDARWAVALLALFSGFAVWNVLGAQRLLRRVR